METGKRGRSVDWTGHVFGVLTVVKSLGWTDAYGKGTGAQLSQWELKCSCGNTVVKTSSNLRSYFNKAEAIKRGEGNSAWRLHCNDHPSHMMPCQIGEYLGDLEVVALPENKGEKLGCPPTWGTIFIASRLKPTLLRWLSTSPTCNASLEKIRWVA